MTDPTPPDPAQTPIVQLQPDEQPEHAGYAVYDNTLARFVTGVYGSKTTADKAVVKVKGHRYTTRAV